MRRSSSADVACGYRQGSVGRGVGRGHRSGVRSGRDGSFGLGRTVGYRRLRALVVTAYSHARAWCTGSRRCTSRRARGSRGRTWRRSTRPVWGVDDQALGRVRPAGGDPRARARRRGGVGGAAITRGRAAGRPGGGERGAGSAARRSAEVAPSGPGAVSPGAATPVAVEVELSVKASRRLQAICCAWGRCRLVSEVRYYAPPQVAWRVRFPVPFRSPRRATSSAYRRCRTRSLRRRQTVSGWPLGRYVGRRVGLLAMCRRASSRMRARRS